MAHADIPKSYDPMPPQQAIVETVDLDTFKHYRYLSGDDLVPQADFPYVCEAWGIPLDSCVDVSYQPDDYTVTITEHPREFVYTITLNPDVEGGIVVLTFRYPGGDLVDGLLTDAQTYEEAREMVFSVDQPIEILGLQGIFVRPELTFLTPILNGGE